MTKVSIGLWAPQPDGVDVPIGAAWLAPTRRHDVVDGTVLPKPFRITAADGPVTVDLEPSGPGWCWSATITASGISTYTEHVVVPASEQTLQYKELVRVDPATLEVEDITDPAWWGEVESLRREFAAIGPRIGYDTDGTPYILPA